MHKKKVTSNNIMLFIWDIKNQKNRKINKTRERQDIYGIKRFVFVSGAMNLSFSHLSRHPTNTSPTVHVTPSRSPKLDFSSYTCPSSTGFC